MKKLIFQTRDYVSPLIPRILLAIVLFPHGAQKLLGWYGGYGFKGTMDFFNGTMGLPWLISLLVILLEFFGPLLLVLGFATRVISIALTGLMLGILITSHLRYGFFMNWFGNQEGEGMEYFILYLSGTLSLLITGAGKWSLDRFINHSNKDLSYES